MFAIRVLPLLLFAAAAFAGGDGFVGRIVYSQSAAGDGDGAKMVRELAPSRIAVHIGAAAYRQDEEGGMNAGSVVIRDGARAALRLDHKAKTSVLGGGAALDDMEQKVKDFMVWHFKTDLAPTDETATICGRATRKYTVKKSAFVRAGATAHVWITEALRVDGRRYSFEFPSHRMTSPIPLSIPTKGLILKAEVLERGTLVTITATEIVAGEPDAALFTKPAGYTGPDFPAPPKTKAAPVRAAVDVSTLAPTLTNGVGMKLVLVKPGTFTMGSPADEPQRKDDEAPHRVTITHPYYVATTEVTQAQWKAVMGADSPSKKKGGNLPVENVTWAQANEFCAKLSAQEGRTYRLPTEAEWEYAARAGETRPAMNAKQRKAWVVARAWMYFNAKYKTHAVATLAPNAWGLFDTLGNVDEWTSSGYGPYPKGAATDPQGTDSSNKVVRGGNWVASIDWIRPAARGTQNADKAKSTIGLRVVCEPTPR